MKILILFFLALFTYATGSFAGDNHSGMLHHEQMIEIPGTVLTEAGNDAFGTIQEVVMKLNNDPETDWTKVNIEALRQHLLDMNDMTLHVEVITQEYIPGGLKAIVRPTTDRAALALERVFKAHPAQLKNETGWDMQVVNNNNLFILTITSENSNDVSKIRGLGYIGLMVYGNHHQPHHWAMATGSNPHAEHE